MNPEKYKPEDSAREQLSTTGNARRQSMRANLKTEFVRIHASRRRNRAVRVWSTLVVFLFAIGVWRIWPRGPADSSNPLAVRQQPAVDSISHPELAANVPTKSGFEFELINDNQLLDMLAEAGHPSALAWIKGKPVVIPLGNNSSL